MHNFVLKMWQMWESWKGVNTFARHCIKVQASFYHQAQRKGYLLISTYNRQDIALKWNDAFRTIGCLVAWQLPGTSPLLIRRRCLLYILWMTWGCKIPVIGYLCLYFESGICAPANVNDSTVRVTLVGRADWIALNFYIISLLLLFIYVLLFYPFLTFLFLFIYLR